MVREGQSGRDKERRGRTGNEMGCKDIVAHFGDQNHIEALGLVEKKMATHEGRGGMVDRLKNKNGILYDKRPRIPSSPNVFSVDFSFFFFFFSPFFTSSLRIFWSFRCSFFFSSTSQGPSYPRFPAGPSRFLSP